MSKKKTDSGLGAVLGMAAGVAAVAGAYYFYGKDGAKHRKTLKSWSVKARGEIMEKMEAMHEVSRKDYEAILAQVLAKYKSMKNIDPKELQELGKELKGHWDAISKTISKVSNTTTKKAKKASTK